MITSTSKNKITSPYFNDPTNRWLPGLSNSDHHSLNAISSSQIKYFHKKSPWSFYKKYVEKDVKDFSFKAEFRTGTLIHLALLEPEIFEKTVVACDHTATTKAYKEFRHGFLSSKKKPKIIIDIPAEIVETAPKLIEKKKVNPFEFPLETKPNVYEEAEKQQLEMQKAKRVRRTKLQMKELREGGIEPNVPEILEENNIVIEEPKTLIETETVKSRKRKSVSKDCQVYDDEEPEPEYFTTKNGGYFVDGTEYFIVNNSDMRMFRKMQTNAKNHARFQSLLGKCEHIEQTGIAQCPRTGLFLSVRGDARSTSGGFFLDPKSTAMLSQYDMERSQSGFLYYLQHAHYLYTANLIDAGIYDRFYFLYASKEDPYEICLTHLDDESVESANNLYFQILDKIAECEYHGKWPKLDNDNGMLLKLPPWAFK